MPSIRHRHLATELPSRYHGAPGETAPQGAGATNAAALAWPAAPRGRGAPEGPGRRRGAMARMQYIIDTNRVSKSSVKLKICS